MNSGLDTGLHTGYTDLLPRANWDNPLGSDPERQQEVQPRWQAGMRENGIMDNAGFEVWHHLAGAGVLPPDFAQAR